MNLLRLTIRQNPTQKRQDTTHHRLCVSLAAQTVDAIAAFTESCPSIVPCGFFFSTALLECIYHLIVAIRAKPSEEERAASIRSFQLAYQLLEQFSQALDTAKRALRALNSVISSAFVSNSVPIVESANPEPEPDHPIDLTFHTTETIDFFDPMSWQIDDIPLDVAGLIASMGNQGADAAGANGVSEGWLDPDLRLWNSDYGVDPSPSNP